MEGFLQRVKKATPSSVVGLAKTTIDAVKPITDKATSAMTVGLGAIGASLSQFADIPLSPEQVTRITSAMKNYGIESVDAVKALPDELTKYGTEVVDQFL